MRRFIVCLVFALSFMPSFAMAWSESGHHLVALLAFDHLNPDQQQQLLEMLAAHPRFKRDFTPSPTIRDGDRFRVGTAGYWPDIARDHPKYNRPSWHYQLGATLTIGDPAGYKVPDTPGPCPENATLETEDLHIAQAFELCRRVMADRNAMPGDRALALCWIAHLAGDAHQPCHAGSYYAEELYPEGDRGGNLIACEQNKNMHALWDGLLGGAVVEDDIDRRATEIKNLPGYQQLGEELKRRAQPYSLATWLAESREAALQYAYTSEVLRPLDVAFKAEVHELMPLNFSPTYMERAGELAKRRAAEAGYRLAVVWAEGLTGPSHHQPEPEEEPVDKPEERFARRDPREPRFRSVVRSPFMTHWLDTDTGLRHNSDCELFEHTEHGKRCRSHIGEPCEDCGG